MFCPVEVARARWPPRESRKSAVAARIVPVVHMDLVGTQRFCRFCRAAVQMCSLLLFCLALVPRTKQHHARIVRCLHLLATAHFSTNPLFHIQHETNTLPKHAGSREQDVPEKVMFLWQLRLGERLPSPCLPKIVERTALVGILIAAVAAACS